MKRLSKFEVESLVNVVVSKLEKIESEKLEKECVKFIGEWNKELVELNNERKIWEDKFKEKKEKIRKEIKVKGWKGVDVNEWFCDNNFVRFNESNFVEWSVRVKIMDEIVINSLKDNNVDSLIDNLINKFKS
jgi:hypothetical protein